MPRFWDYSPEVTGWRLLKVLVAIRTGEAIASKVAVVFWVVVTIEVLVDVEEVDKTRTIKGR